MNRKFRLAKSADFKRVRQFGKSYSHPLVVLIAYPNDLQQVRIAVAAGRSVGKAVHRNRAKRLIRAAAVELLPNIPTGYDLILLARNRTLHATLKDILAALSSLLVRARLNRTPNGI